MMKTCGECKHFVKDDWSDRFGHCGCNVPVWVLLYCNIDDLRDGRCCACDDRQADRCDGFESITTKRQDMDDHMRQIKELEDRIADLELESTMNRKRHLAWQEWAASCLCGLEALPDGDVLKDTVSRDTIEKMLIRPDPSYETIMIAELRNEIADLKMDNGQLTKEIDRLRAHVGELLLMDQCVDRTTMETAFSALRLEVENRDLRVENDMLRSENGMLRSLTIERSNQDGRRGLTLEQLERLLAGECVGVEDIMQDDTTRRGSGR